MRLTLAALLSLTALPALADPPRVLTDLTPTGALVREVAGDLARVEVLLPGGAGAHDYQMRPSAARALQEADLLVWMGPEMTPWLDRPARNLAGANAQLQLLDVDGTRLRDFGADEDHATDGHADEDHPADDHPDEHPDEGHADHDHAGIDPHAWLDPANARPWLLAVADALAAADPDHADDYRANADDAAARIDTAADDLRARLAPHADRDFVVFHDAYGYFTDAFGLRPAIAVALGDASAPSAGRVDEIRTRLRESGAVCAFPEYAHDPRLVETAIEGTPIRMGRALSPEGGDGAASDYAGLLTELGASLIACFEAE